MRVIVLVDEFGTTYARIGNAYAYFVDTDINRLIEGRSLEVMIVQTSNFCMQTLLPTVVSVKAVGHEHELAALPIPVSIDKDIPLSKYNSLPATISPTASAVPTVENFSVPPVRGFKNLTNPPTIFMWVSRQKNQYVVEGVEYLDDTSVATPHQNPDIKDLNARRQEALLGNFRNKTNYK